MHNLMPSVFVQESRKFGSKKKKKMAGNSGYNKMNQLGVLLLFSRWDVSELLEASVFLFDRYSVENSTHISNPG